MEKTNRPDIETAEIKLRSGSKLHLFINRETNLLVIDLFDEGMTGGNELVRAYIDERKLLAHCDSGSAHLPTVKSSRDVVVLTESGALDAYHLKYGLKLPYRAEPKKEEPTAYYFLESISTEIIEDSFEHGEGKNTGCGLDHERISKAFASKQEMLKWILDNYGYTDFEDDDCNCQDQDSPFATMRTGLQVADHSQDQNGGWMQPTYEEIESWKLGQCKLYSEYVIARYHLIEQPCGCGDDKEHPLRTSCKKHGQLYTSFDAAGDAEAARAEAEADAAAANAEYEAEQREADEERDRDEEPPHNEGYD